MRSEDMPSGDYFSYTNPNQQYAPDSPDTFYAHVSVQPPTSDSAQTPPSPSPVKPQKSRHRHRDHTDRDRTAVSRTIAPPLAQTSSSNNHNSTPNTSYSRSAGKSQSRTGPSSAVRKERERALANTSHDSLVRALIYKEHDYKEAKHLLAGAILQVEALQERLSREEEGRRALEEEVRVSGSKTTKAILDTQGEAMRAKEDTAIWKLKAENLEKNLRRANERVRAVEAERDELDGALVRARSTARQLKEKNVVLQAREEGRREGFEEGLRQGRIQQEAALAAAAAEEEAAAAAAELERKEKAKKGSDTSRSRKSAAPPPVPSIPLLQHEYELERTKSELARGYEAEALRTKMQLNESERQLDKEREKNKRLERELRAVREDLLRAEREKKAAEEARKRVEEEKQRVQEEKRRIEDDKRRVEAEMEGVRNKVKETEREKEELRRREEETLRRAASEKRRLTEETEREKLAILQEKERVEQEKAAAEARAREEVERERARARHLEEEMTHEHDVQAQRERERAEREREKDERAERERDAAVEAARLAGFSAAVGASSMSGSNHSASMSPAVGLKTQHDYKSQPYFPMPPPPQGGVGMPVPSVPSLSPFPGSNAAFAAGSASGSMPQPIVMPSVPRTGSSRHGHGRRDSLSSSASTMQFDILQFPGEGRSDRGELGVIPEDASIRSGWGAPPGTSFPEPSIPNIVPQGMGGGGGIAFPSAEVPNIVDPGRQAAGAGGIAFPNPDIPQIIPRGHGGAPTPGASFPQPEVPEIIPRGGAPTPGGGAAFPQPEIPNIVPRGMSGSVGSSAGAGGGGGFPQPEVPEIIPRGMGTHTPGGGGGGAVFPQPEIPNIIPRGMGGSMSGSVGSAAGGPEYPTPSIPNIVPRGGGGAPTPGGGAAFPQPEIPNIVPRGGPSPGGGAAFSMPEVNIPNIVPKGVAGMDTPGPGPVYPSTGTPGPGPAYPTAEVPMIIPPPRGAGTSSVGETFNMPEPEIPNIIPKGVTSGGHAMPAPEIPDIIPKGGPSPSGGSGGAGGGMFPQPDIPNYMGGGKNGRPGSRAASTTSTSMMPTPAIPNIVPKGGRAASSASGGGMPTPVIPDIVPKGGRAGSAAGSVGFPTAEVPTFGGETPRGMGMGGRSKSRSGSAVGIPTPEIPNIVPKGGASMSGGSNSGGGFGFPTAEVPTFGPGGNAATPSWPAAEVPNFATPRGGNANLGGASPRWPSAEVPNITSDAGGIPGWPTVNTPNSMLDPPDGNNFGSWTDPNMLSANKPRPLDRMGSNGSWTAHIHPPSRSPSLLSATVQEQDGGFYLSPNHRTSALPPQTQPKSQPRRRNGGNGDVPTQPNTPVVLNGPLPPGFVPQTLTDRNGISTPVWPGTTDLPSMGQPAPVIPPMSNSGKYGNPLRDGEGGGGGPPPMFPRSPAGSVRPLGTPGPGWASLGGATPAMSARDLPGVAGSGGGGVRPGSIYGAPPMGTPIQMPAPPVTMPVPTVPDLEDENDDGFDMNTTLNTQMNAKIGSTTTTLVTEKAKKKKKKR